MWHFLALAIAYASIVASPADAAPRGKGPPPDPFKACDLQVREDLREGGTWLIPRDIRLDEGRLMVSVTFVPEKPIRSVPKVVYGNSDEERRRQLREVAAPPCRSGRLRRRGGSARRCRLGQKRRDTETSWGSKSRCRRASSRGRPAVAAQRPCRCPSRARTWLPMYLILRGEPTRWGPPDGINWRTAARNWRTAYAPPSMRQITADVRGLRGHRALLVQLSKAIGGIQVSDVCAGAANENRTNTRA
jgi:hypothetical protein